MEELRQGIARACKKLFKLDVEPELMRPDEQFGDYSTNVAMKLAPQLGRTPREIAEELKGELELIKGLASIDVAGPGFINIRVSDDKLAASLDDPRERPLEGKTVVTEYSDPNPFKVLHAGHLYTSVVGDSIANLLEAAGAKVYRVNFGGDVGLHVAKSMWAILRLLGGEEVEKLGAVQADERADWLSQRYVEGNEAYASDESSKAEIDQLNKKLYELHDAGDKESQFARIYWTCRQWSYDYLKLFYQRIGSRFDRFYPESEVAPTGLAAVQEQVSKGIFEESDGAVVFKGDEFGLHTRVFITSQGLPTYEAKDVGLALRKESDYRPDMSVIITGNDIVEYMKVVMKALEQFSPATVAGTRHLTHGIVKLPGSEKMSSRKGNVLKAEDIIDEAALANQEASGSTDEAVVLGAVKYSFLKQRLGGDIIYEPQESVSLQGNSGPYLQYALVRAKSILKKAPAETSEPEGINFMPIERSLARQLSLYGEVVSVATDELMPHHLCTYLYELAQTFNRFYEQCQILGDERQDIRLVLLRHYAIILEDGLKLLGIPALEQM